MKITDKVGVCLQLADTTGPCRFPAKVDEAMRYLGLTMIRTRAPQFGADSWRIYIAVAARGYRFVFTHRPGQDVVREVAAMTELDRLFPGCIIGYEGPNEPDLNPVTHGKLLDRRLAARVGQAPAALALMKAQRTEIRKVKALAKVQIIAFNDWMQAEQKAFTNLANSHIYPKNAALAARLAEFDRLVASHGRGQGVITEWGYHNAIGEAKTAPGITEAQAALNYAADIAAIMVNPRVEWAFMYTGTDGYGTGEFSRFGLFRSDWTPKPAAQAVRAVAVS